MINDSILIILNCLITRPTTRPNGHRPGGRSGGLLSFYFYLLSL